MPYESSNRAVPGELRLGLRQRAADAKLSTATGADAA